MKIYLGTPLPSINKLENICQPKQYNYTLLYSLNGIYKYENNQFYKQIITDNDLEYIIINNKKATIDPSIINYVKESYQLPHEHAIVDIIEKHYKYNTASLVINQFDEYYFLVDKNYNLLDILEILSYFY